MSSETERERLFLEALWEQIPAQASVVLGVTVALGKMKLSEGLEELGKKQYFATMTTDRPRRIDIFLGFDDRSAIAFSGLLVMMQEKVINEKMSRREMDDDDLDAMSECVNQLGSAINKALHEALGSEYHVVLNGGGLKEPAELDRYRSGRIVIARGKITVGTLHEGEFRIVIPDALFGTGQDSAATGTGLAFTPEEAEALRQATMASLSGQEKLHLFLPLSRDLANWQALVEELGIETEITRDLHELRQSCQKGEVTAIVIDADACEYGGLPALAKLVAGTGRSIPIIVAASRPTRTHLISCLASGAATYVVKPIAADALRETVSQIVTHGSVQGRLDLADSGS
jgi:CheY-like chemotaxis protein